jgi:hypothetical protein
MKNAIFTALHTTGWIKDRITNAATKRFVTAVGLKEGIVYVRVIDKDAEFKGIKLSAEYWSTGRNILESTKCLINSTDSHDVMTTKISDFLHKIECEISSSYAVRLMRAA